jgi:hypothetical protein
MIATHPRLFWLCCLLLLLAALLCAWLFPFPMHAQSDPHLAARWDTATSATISWTQTTRGCLSVMHATGERVFITCREKPGTQIVPLGGPLTDGAYRPTAGDIYILQTGGVVYRAPLIARPVYMPVHRR